MKKCVMWRVLWIFLALAAGCSSMGRRPASEEVSDRLRIGVYEISSENKLMVLGVDRSGSSDPQATDLTALGFKGKNLEHVDPKFLFLVNRHGVNSVQSFEMDFLFWRSKSGKGLPPQLLNVPYARRDLLLHASADFAIWPSLFFFPSAPIGVAIGRWVDERENRKIEQAAYLQTLLDGNLDENRFPVLREELTRKQIEELGAALVLRYHPTSEYGGLFVSKQKRVEFYDTLRAVAAETEYQNLTSLVRVCNEQGLVVIPMTSRFAMVFYDRTSMAPKEHWKSFLINADSPEKREKVYRNLAFEKGTLVPLGIYSMDVEHAPVKLIDYGKPFQNPERNVILADTARDLGYTFVPIPFLSLGLRAVDGAMRFIVKKEGKTVFDSPLRSYAELAAILETHAVEVDMNQVLLEAFSQNLEQWGLSEEEVTRFRARLRSADRKVVEDAVNEINTLMGGKEAERSHLFPKSERKTAERKKLYLERLQNILKNEKALKKLNKQLTKAAEKEEARDRKPGSSEAAKKGREIKPVILFLTDGMRPDRLHRAAEAGWVPHIKSLFIDKGMEITSFSSRSLTLPSWSTILTGFEPDEHGVRGNNPASREDGGKIKSIEDPRKDMVLPKYIDQGMSYRLLSRSGLAWLPKYFEREETLLNFMPINDGAYPPVAGLLGAAAGSLDEVFYDIFPAAETLDRVSAEKTARAIRKHPGKYRLVVNWYASVDRQSHVNNRLLPAAIKTVDSAIGTVLAAARRDPVLKDAKVFLISDHGHSGGREEGATAEQLGLKSYTMKNTGFNLAKFFHGDFVESRDYHFVVGAVSSPEPKYDLFFLRDFQIHPFSYTYGSGLSDGGRSMLIDSSGDKLAQVFVRGPSNKWSNDRLDFYGLSHYKDETHPVEKDIPGDLLRQQLKNTALADLLLRERLFALTGNRPVSLFAMALPGRAAKESADRLGGSAETGLSEREPVILRDYLNRTSMVLSRRTVAGEEEFRYIVIRNFSQDSSGLIHGEVSNMPEDDPLGYIGRVQGAENPALWRTDRQWLWEARDHEKPTALFALNRVLTLAPRMGMVPARAAELPDFAVVANYGFGFHGGDEMESDHGGITGPEVRTCLFIGGLGASQVAKPAFVNLPVLTRDIGPTILDYAGLTDDARLTHGKSIKPAVDLLEGRTPGTDGDFVIGGASGF